MREKISKNINTLYNIIKYVGDIMMVFKSIESQKDINYDEVHFKKLGKELAKKSIANLKKEISELSDV